MPCIGAAAHHRLQATYGIRMATTTRSETFLRDTHTPLALHARLPAKPSNTLGRSPSRDVRPTSQSLAARPPAYLMTTPQRPPHKSLGTPPASSLILIPASVRSAGVKSSKPTALAVCPIPTFILLVAPSPSLHSEM